MASWLVLPGGRALTPEALAPHTCKRDMGVAAQGPEKLLLANAWHMSDRHRTCIYALTRAPSLLHHPHQRTGGRRLQSPAKTCDLKTCDCKRSETDGLTHFLNAWETFQQG